MTNTTHKGQRIGYIRVSTVDQNTARQHEALEPLGLDRVFEDKASGKDTNRPALTECLRYLRDGDTLVVHSMDRLARNTLDLLATVRELTERGVSVQFVKQGLTFTADQSDPMAKLMLTMMAAFAEFERDLIRERQAEGIAAAKERGVYKGRAPLHEDKLKEVDRYIDAGMSAVKACAKAGISRAAYYARKKAEG